MTQPVYEHGCKDCVFLTAHPTKEEGMVDLYFCPNGYGGSVVSRWGSRGSEYWSVPAKVLQDGDMEDAVFDDFLEHTGLKKGFHLARERGLLSGV